MSAGSSVRDNASKKPRGVGIWLTVIAGALLALMMFLPAAFILVCIGMAPTVVAVMIDGNRGARALPCMAALNFAGVIPVITMLAEQGRSVSAAMQLLRDAFVWGLMYGGAGVAVFLLWCCPLVVRSWNETTARRDQKQMEKMRKKLIAEWGNQIVKDAAHTGAMGSSDEPPSGSQTLL